MTLETSLMNLTPGELYFIGEIDLLTMKETPYVKIGLVKEVGDRTSQARAAEHQTGNPRRLHVANVVKTHAISEVENIVHKLYAPHRISGEWFHFTTTELKRAIATAQTLSKEINSNIASFQQAAKWKDELSTEKILKPTPAILKTYDEYQRAQVRITRCSEIIKQVKDLFREAIATGEDVSHMARWQEKTIRVAFDQSQLQVVYPKLYEEFCETSESLFARFGVIKPKGPLLPLERIDKQFYDFGLEIEAMIEKAKKKGVKKEDLFKQYLRLLGFKARAELDQDIAEAIIKVVCKRAGGIEGVCKWQRVMKSGEVFDEEGFIAAHPKVAKKFMITVQPQPAFILAQKHAFAFEEED
jgi:hypothetical protein